MERITRKTRIAVKHFHTVNMLAGKCDFEILLPVQRLETAATDSALLFIA